MNYFVREEDDWPQLLTVDFAVRIDNREHLVVAIGTLFVCQMTQMIARNYSSAEIFQTIATTRFAARYYNVRFTRPLET